MGKTCRVFNGTSLGVMYLIRIMFEKRWGFLLSSNELKYNLIIYRKLGGIPPKSQDTTLPSRERRH